MTSSDLLLGSKDWGEFYVILKAYLDESGIHGNSPVCVVAGFVAPHYACVPLDGEWRGLLKRYNLTFFHAKEFALRGGHFRHWDDKRFGKFMVDAFAILNEEFDRLYFNESRAFMVGAAVRPKDFMALSEDERRWLTGAKRSSSGTKWVSMGATTKPYFLPFQQTVCDAVRFSKSGTVQFVFDQQNEFERTGLTLTANLKRQHPDLNNRMGAVSFVSKEKEPLLQVADFIAYSSYRVLSRGRASPDEKRLFQNSIFSGFSDHTRTVFITSEHLRRMLDLCPVIPGKQFVWPVPEENAPKIGIPMGVKVVSLSKG